jgi:uncharacterized membrane protein
MKLFSMIDDFLRSPIGLLVTACVIALALWELGTFGVIAVLLVLGLYLLVKSAAWSVTRDKTH